MSDANALLSITWLLYAITLAFSIFWLVRQPQHINQTYGYCTPRSMKSIEHRKYANKLAAKLSIIMAHIHLLCSLLVYCVYVGSQFHVILAVLVVACALPVMIGILLICIVEYKLKKRFP